MMNTKDRLQVLNSLREYLINIDSDEKEELFLSSGNENPWFDKVTMEHAFNGVLGMLEPDPLQYLVKKYESKNAKKIAVVCAGNLPGVGFQDLILCFLFSEKVFVKLSSSDSYFIKYLVAKMSFFNAEVEKCIQFEEQLVLDQLDGVIATGSDNTARYFEKYFSKIPSVIRKNRTSIAVLNGEESPEELQRLGNDIFIYYGLGCRNVSKLLVPRGYDFVNFLDQLEGFKKVTFHHRYSNNYDYNRSVYLVNREPHFDNGFLMLNESKNLVSPISVLFYEYYDSQEDVLSYIRTNKEKIQVVVSNYLEGAIPLGDAQKPSITDFPDNVNIIEFILSL